MRKKYQQVGNAVPLGLGEALGRSLVAASEEEPDEELVGRFETFNLDLLSKLARRPRTIVNPPRMRKDDEENTISDWHGDGERMRDDAFQYVPVELAEELEARVGRQPARARRHGGNASHIADEAQTG